MHSHIIGSRAAIDTYPSLSKTTILHKSLQNKDNMQYYTLKILLRSMDSPHKGSVMRKAFPCHDIPDSKVHEAHLGPTGPRWAPCWPHEPCYHDIVSAAAILTIITTSIIISILTTNTNITIIITIITIDISSWRYQNGGQYHPSLTFIYDGILWQKYFDKLFSWYIPVNVFSKSIHFFENKTRFSHMISTYDAYRFAFVFGREYIFKTSHLPKMEDWIFVYMY